MTVYALAIVASTLLAASAQAADLLAGARDTAGRPASLTGLAGPSGLVLIVFRSARHCPECRRRLANFRASRADLASRGYGLAVVSRDSPETLAVTARRWAIDYPLLSVVSMTTPLPLERRQPSVLVLTPRGAVEARLISSSYGSPDVGAAIAAIDALPRCMTPSVRQPSVPTTCQGRPASIPIN
ncbi:peroxiredoxin family protein [Phenylobacterium montanum]|nr:redoxin domain-containing protein [Caulobacter sp. S6]